MGKEWGEASSFYSKICSYIGLKCPTDVGYYREIRQPARVRCQLFRGPEAGDFNRDLCGSWMKELMLKTFNVLLQDFSVGHWPQKTFITPNTRSLNNSDAWKPSALQARRSHVQLLLICSCHKIFVLNCFSLSNIPRAKDILREGNHSLSKVLLQ